MVQVAPLLASQGGRVTLSKVSDDSVALHGHVWRLSYTRRCPFSHTGPHLGALTGYCYR